MEQKNTPGAVSANDATESSLTMRLGRTTYIIGLHFNDKADEGMEDKVRKLIRKDVETGNF